MDFREYWKRHWNKDSINANSSLLSQVERTFRGEPLDNKIWQEIFLYVSDQLHLDQLSVVLDLCAGNGLFAIPISKIAMEIVAVDFSANLLKKINDEKIKIKEVDVNELVIEKDYYTHTLLYAGIQYFDEKETLNIFEKVYNGLRKDGVFFIGEIPDRLRLWDFANTDIYKSQYFENLKNATPAIGNWYLRNDLLEMGKYVGFKDIQIMNQPSYYPYHYFKFDMILVK